MELIIETPVQTLNRVISRSFDLNQKMAIIRLLEVPPIDVF